MSSASAKCIRAQDMMNRLQRYLTETRTAQYKAGQTEAMQKREAALRPFDGNRSMLDFEAQKGRGMSRQEFCKRLLKLNPKLEFEPSTWSPDVWGVYIRDGESNLTSPLPRYRGVKFVCGLPSTFLTEGTLVQNKIVRKKGSLTGEVIETEESKGKIPGWRDVLKTLIKSGLISYAAADKEFFFSRRESARWAQVMQ